MNFLTPDELEKKQKEQLFEKFQEVQNQLIEKWDGESTQINLTGKNKVPEGIRATIKRCYEEKGWKIEHVLLDDGDGFIFKKK